MTDAKEKMKTALQETYEFVRSSQAEALRKPTAESVRRMSAALRLQEAVATSVALAREKNTIAEQQSVADQLLKMVRATIEGVR